MRIVTVSQVKRETADILINLMKGPKRWVAFIDTKNRRDIKIIRTPVK